ncbi:MAG: hypothetical protein CVV07_00820 [Gammaproteobacteria bacterium HGW-Gammaproteobacteria-11]|nr:MAG: hypothetical protein CVV07_00820 [Gammaproteobacteria bacterium HGW-Gammaproteobacteria-11]
MVASYRSALLAFGLLICAAGVQAQHLKLVTGEDYPPFAGNDLADGGSLARLVSVALQDAGHTSEIAFKPWSRGYEETLSLAFDATFPYQITPDREADFLFSAPLYEVRSRFYVLQDSALHSGERDELRNAVICLPIGYALNGWVAQHSQEANLVRPRNMDQCHEMLIRGRVDALISNAEGVAFQLFMRQEENSLLRPLPHSLANSSLHLIISRQHPQASQILTRFNNSLTALRDSGRLLQIVAEPVAIIPAQTP